MSHPVYHKHCVIGNHMFSGPGRVVGLDQSRWPAAPPVSLYACDACIAISRYTGIQLIRPGQQPALPYVPQPDTQLNLLPGAHP